MIIFRAYRLLVIFLLLGAIQGCKKTEKSVEENADKSDAGSYYSIKAFIYDQYNSFHDQPFSFTRTIILNGKKDSSIVNVDSVDWGAVFRMFFATDISDKKFLGKYKFSMFDDNMTMTKNFYYEAIDDDLFTRTLQISADDVSNKIKSIYVQTEKKSMTNEVSQKLYYSPLKVIQIQETQKNKLGASRELYTEYRFF